MTTTDITSQRHTSKGRTPSPAVARQLADDRARARRALAAGDTAEAWRLLERTHILSQPWARPHVRSHVDMLRLAVRARDRREALGQLLRIAVAGPGSATGRYPLGNTGRARVSATLPMPVPEDLARLLAST
jgi:hypothetical protein